MGQGSLMRMMETGELIRRIGRYTRMVFVGKWTLAGMSLLILGAVIVIPLLEQTRDGARISFVSSKVVTGNDQPVMEKPKLQGLDAQDQPYTITASRAIQESATKVRMFEVQGDLFSNGSWLNLTADRGLFDKTKSTLLLEGNVVLYRDDGTVVNTTRAEIDTKAGSARADAPISGQGPLGTLNGVGYSIEQSGAVMRVGKPGERVKVRIVR
jgi:lipopolysaccharide export system protein LptC